MLEIDALANLTLPEVKRKGGHVVHIKNKDRLVNALKTTSQLGVSQPEEALGVGKWDMGQWPMSRHTTRRLNKPSRSQNASSIDGDAIIAQAMQSYETNKLLIPADPRETEVSRFRYNRVMGVLWSLTQDGGMSPTV